MKKYLLPVIFLAGVVVSSAQNLVVNGNFETGMLAPWGGFNNQVLTDDMTSSFVGNANNAEASLFQEFDVMPGLTYKVVFQYRWVSGATSYNCIVRVKDAANLPPNMTLIGGTTADGFKLNETPDTWYNGEFYFVPPTGVTRVRLLYYKANNNRPLRIDNVSVTQDVTASLHDLQPFNFSAGPNPATDFINLSADKPIDKVEFYSMSGRLVQSQAVNSSRAWVGIGNLSKGFYIVKVHMAHRTGAYKLIVE